MEAWFLYLITKSISYAIFIVIIVTFLESLALVGLFLPGIVFMSILGTFIGNGTLNFYPAWIAGVFGCMCGDWISYYCGWKFKNYLENFSLLEKNNIVLNKVITTVKNHPIITILVGKFIGPIRPLIPMVCGMLNISLKKFVFPNVLGCVLWPPIYFFPGIIAGIAIHTTKNNNDNIYLKFYFLCSIFLIWLGTFLLWKIWKKNNYINIKKKILSNKYLLFFSITSLFIGITIMIYIQSNPQIIFFRKLLYKIFIFVE